MGKRIPISFTRQFIKQNIVDLRYVKDAAKGMGYSRSYFSISVKKKFKKSALEILQDARISKIIIEIKKNPNEISYSIAKRVGLKNEKQMYKFLASSRLKTNFTSLRKRILSGKKLQTQKSCPNKPDH